VGLYCYYPLIYSQPLSVVLLYTFLAIGRRHLLPILLTAIMPLSSQVHLLRSVLSQQSRRGIPSSLFLQSSTTTTSSRHHQKRPITTSTTPLYAQPNKYVTGVTTEQVANSQAMQDWYNANFGKGELWYSFILHLLLSLIYLFYNTCFYHIMLLQWYSFILSKCFNT